MYWIITLAEVLTLMYPMVAFSRNPYDHLSPTDNEFPGHHFQYGYAPRNERLVQYRYPPMNYAVFHDSKGRQLLNEELRLREINSENRALGKAIRQQMQSYRPLSYTDGHILYYAPGMKLREWRKVGGNEKHMNIRSPYYRYEIEPWRRSYSQPYTRRHLNFVTGLEKDSTREARHSGPSQQDYAQYGSNINGKEGQMHVTGPFPQHIPQGYGPLKERYSYRREPSLIFPKSPPMFQMYFKNRGKDQAFIDSNANRRKAFMEQHLEKGDRMLSGYSTDEYFGSSDEKPPTLERQEVIIPHFTLDKETSSLSERNSYVLKRERPLITEVQSKPFNVVGKSNVSFPGNSESNEAELEEVTQGQKERNPNSQEDNLKKTNEIPSVLRFIHIIGNEALKSVYHRTGKNEVPNSPSPENFGKRSLGDEISAVINWVNDQKKPEAHMEANKETAQKVDLGHSVSVQPGLLIVVVENEGNTSGAIEEKELIADHSESDEMEASNDNETDKFEKGTKRRPRKNYLSLKEKIKITLGNNEENFHSSIQLHGTKLHDGRSLQSEDPKVNEEEREVIYDGDKEDATESSEKDARDLFRIHLQMSLMNSLK